MADAHQELLELLGAELAVLERFEQCLEREHQALRGHELAQLEETAAEKQSVGAELEACHSRRCRLIDASGHNGQTREGMEQFIQQASADELREKLALRWNKVGALLERCRDQNIVNGELVEFSRQYTYQSLSILLGADTGGAELYDRHGGKSGTAGGRSHVKA